MIIIIGLGNPGLKYQKTRHNVGQVILKKFANDFYFPKFKLDKNLQAQVSKKDDILLALPTTFMNESGISVNKLIKNKLQFPSKAGQPSAEPNYPITQLPNLWVIHDDLDLDLEEEKISFNSSSAGHNGVQSVIDKLGSQNFVRFRIGIKSPDTNFIDVKKFVLKRFNRKEKKIVEQSINLTCEAINFVLEQGIEKAQAKYNF